MDVSEREKRLSGFRRTVEATIRESTETGGRYAASRYTEPHKSPSSSFYTCSDINM